MSAPAAHATFQPPELEEVVNLFPNYDIYSLIACGGMGAVYHANQRSLDRGVAIKILPREFSQDMDFRVSFELEAKAMAKLNHPNLIGVYDFGDVDGMLFIVMEYVPGSSLYALSHGRVVEQNDALKIVCDVCRGLDHAHHYGILHRDIKPSNILLDPSGSPKIGDFGLASAMGHQVQEGDQIFGTPGYTAPEVIEPPHTFDHRADIYSVGVMLYELLTGVTPDGHHPISSLPRIPNAKLHAIIQRATHPDPNARHSSADELAVELEKIAALPSNPLLTGTNTRGLLGKTASVKVSARGVAMTPAMSSPASVATVKSAGVKVVVNSGGGPRPLVPARKMPVRKKSSSGAVILIAILLAAVGAIYYFVIKPSSDPAPVPPAPAPVVQDTPTKVNVGILPRKTAAEEGLKPIDDVDAFFVRVENIMKGRIKNDLQTYRQGIQANTLEFEAKAKEAVSAMDSNTAASVSANLYTAMQEWEKKDYRMPDQLPGPLKSNATINDLFTNYFANQSKIRGKFVDKLTTEQGTYLIGLQRQIDKYREQNDTAGVTMLEKEVARINSEPGYYEFIVSK